MLGCRSATAVTALPAENEYCFRNRVKHDTAAFHADRQAASCNPSPRATVRAAYEAGRSLSGAMGRSPSNPGIDRIMSTAAPPADSGSSSSS